jgi:hypothetical protein
MGLAAPKTPEEIAKAKELGDIWDRAWEEAVDCCIDAVQRIGPIVGVTEEQANALVSEMLSKRS